MLAFLEGDQSERTYFSPSKNPAIARPSAMTTTQTTIGATHSPISDSLSIAWVFSAASATCLCD